MNNPRRPLGSWSPAEPVDVAWVAGIVEGEGSIYGSLRSREVRVGVGMTDHDIIERLQTITGLGQVDGPFLWANHGKRKAIWRWRVWRRAEVDDLLVHLYPWLGIRRQVQVQEAYLRAERSMPTTSLGEAV